MNDEIKPLRVSEAKQVARNPEILRTVKKAEAKASFDRPRVFDAPELKAFFCVGEKIYRIARGKASPTSLGTLEGVVAGLRPELSASAVSLLAKRFKAVEAENFDAVIQAPHLKSGAVELNGSRLYNAIRSTYLPNEFDGDAASTIEPLLLALKALFPNEVEYWAHMLAMQHFIKLRVNNEQNPERQTVGYNQSIILVGPAGFGKSVYANYIWGLLLGRGSKPEDRSIGERDMFNANLYTAPYLHIEDQLLDGSMSESKVWSYIKAFNSKDSRNARAMHTEGTDVPGNWPLIVSANMGATFSLPDYRHHEDDSCKMIYSAVSNASDAFIAANPDRSSDGFETRYGVAFRHWLLRDASCPEHVWKQLSPSSSQARYATRGYINDLYKREITTRPDKYFMIKTQALKTMNGQFRAEELFARASEINKDLVRSVSLLGLQRALSAWVVEGLISVTEDGYHVKTYQVINKSKEQLEAF